MPAKVRVWLDLTQITVAGVDGLGITVGTLGTLGALGIETTPSRVLDFPLELVR